MERGSVICLILLGMIFASTTNTQASKSGISQPDQSVASSSDPLTSLGDITTKLVTTLVQAEDEQVDIYGMANLVTALSKAATIVEHPDMYKEMTTNDLEEQLVKLSSTVKILAEQQKNLQDTIDLQQEQLLVIDEMAYELNQSQTVIKRLEEQLENGAIGSGSDFVGFTAWADVSSSYRDEDTIKFPQVLFNYGSGYDSYSGKFTCPVSGVYSVNVHLEERNSGGLIIDAMLDTESLFRVHVHDDSNEHGTSATSAMVGCRQGQTIYMVTQDSGSNAEVQSIEKRSIFSVYLVKTMSDEEVRSGNLIGS